MLNDYKIEINIWIEDSSGFWRKTLDVTNHININLNENELKVLLNCHRVFILSSFGKCIGINISYKMAELKDEWLGLYRIDKDIFFETIYNTLKGYIDYHEY